MKTKKFVKTFRRSAGVSMLEYVMFAGLVALTFYAGKVGFERALEQSYQHRTQQVEPFAVRNKVLLSERNL
ncbi:MAG: hypothetical protein KDD70_08305 [Bdellovibrionales bacterium]|nr:hypothetical protein [Bdellovibrionales bacterium]